ncbi:DNA-directed RNA polymerase subunit RPC12/RpoP [Elusimicrobium posterum]|uniref:hypothetical protein n=1 Tax=Elusimicrobium posterum TaxID=3116653 RepID=UPI003C792B45
MNKVIKKDCVICGDDMIFKKEYSTTHDQYSCAYCAHNALYPKATGGNGEVPGSDE